MPDARTLGPEGPEGLDPKAGRVAALDTQVTRMPPPKWVGR